MLCHLEKSEARLFFATDFVYFYTDPIIRNILDDNEEISIGGRNVNRLRFADINDNKKSKYSIHKLYRFFFFLNLLHIYIIYGLLGTAPISDKDPY